MRPSASCSAGLADIRGLPLHRRARRRRDARADLPRERRRQGARGHRPAALRRGRPDRRLHGDDPPALRTDPVRAGDGREGRRRRAADHPRLSAAAAEQRGARRAAGPARARLQRGRAARAPAGGRRGAAAAGRRGARQLLAPTTPTPSARCSTSRASSTPACASARALEPLELLDAGQAHRARARPGRAGRAPRPARDRHRHPAAGRAARSRHERMTLPHEQLLSRRFVLIPALELDFGLRAPAASGWPTPSPRSRPRRACAGQGRPWACPAPEPARRRPRAAALPRDPGRSVHDDPAAHPFGAVDRAVVGERPGVGEA